MKKLIKNEKDFLAFIKQIEKKYDVEDIAFDNPTEYPCIVIVSTHTSYHDISSNKIYFDYIYQGDFDGGYDDSLVNKAKSLEGAFYPITGGDSGHNVIFPLADGKNALVIHEDCEDNWKPHVHLISMEKYNSLVEYEKKYKDKCW